MLRKDYEKFLAVAPNELKQDEYFLQKEFSEHWPMFFTKLRKNGTACIERQLPKDRLMHQGIYIDIFPCDNLSNNPIARWLQFLASKVVIAKSVYERGYITDNWMKKVFIQLCRLLPLKPFWKFATGAKMIIPSMSIPFSAEPPAMRKTFYQDHGLNQLFFSHLRMDVIQFLCTMMNCLQNCMVTI